MRLTNINCPQCNGQLNQQEDKFYCTSCGSAFNIDYEASDVEYAKLVTEPERTRLLLEKDRVLLEKNAELRRKFYTSEMKHELVHQAKTMGTYSLGAAFYAAVIGGISFLCCVIVIVGIFFNIDVNHKSKTASREQARNERLESLSVDDVRSDTNFLENAIAYGVSSELWWRDDDPVENKVDDRGDAYIVGTPVASNIYFLKNGHKNYVYIVFKITYEYSNDKSQKDIYSCHRFGLLEPDETGHIKFADTKGSWEKGNEFDEDWYGYESLEALREDLFPKGFDVYEIFM